MPWDLIFAAYLDCRRAEEVGTFSLVFVRVSMVFYFIPSNKGVSMRARSGLIVVLSSLFLFSACAEVKTSSIGQQLMERLAGRWDVIGYSQFPTCIAQFSGELTIHKDGIASLLGGNACFRSGSVSTLLLPATFISIQGSVVGLDPDGRGEIEWKTASSSNIKDSFQVIKRNHRATIIKMDGLFLEPGYRFSYHWILVPHIKPM